MQLGRFVNSKTEKTSANRHSEDKSKTRIEYYIYTDKYLTSTKGRYIKSIIKIRIFARIN